MNEPSTTLFEFLSTSGKSFCVLEHTPCRTSAESAAMRAAAGVPGTIGAKALLIKEERTGKFHMAVLPGPARLDGKIVRNLIGTHKFATPDEIADLTSGLERGMIPPFGKPLFPKISSLIVDTQIRSIDMIGFNMACLNKSVVMSGSDYLEICQADREVKVSKAQG